MSENFDKPHEPLNKLNELLKRLDKTELYDHSEIRDVKNKLQLYIAKFFSNKPQYKETLDQIKTHEMMVDHEFWTSVADLKGVITTLVEDMELSGYDEIIKIEEKRQKIFIEARQEAENLMGQLQAEKEKISKDVIEIQHIKEGLLKEGEKLNEFKVKLEVADKNRDFDQEADKNKKAALKWSIFAMLLIGILIILLYCSFNNFNTFALIAKKVNDELKTTNLTNNNEVVANTIGFTFWRFIFTKLLLYSMIIYAIVFCVKNYNSQMHNNIINVHKANSLKSTLSLLNTANSDDSKDKILIQATQAIFSHQQTGYSGKENEPSSPNLVTNIVDSISKKV